MAGRRAVFAEPVSRARIAGARLHATLLGLVVASLFAARAAAQAPATAAASGSPRRSAAPAS